MLDKSANDDQLIEALRTEFEKQQRTIQQLQRQLSQPQSPRDNGAQHSLDQLQGRNKQPTLDAEFLVNQILSGMIGS